MSDNKQFDPHDIPVEITVESIEIPKDQVWLLVGRRPNESLIDWASRCCVIYNVVLPKDGFRVQPPDNG